MDSKEKKSIINSDSNNNNNYPGKSSQREEISGQPMNGHILDVGYKYDRNIFWNFDDMLVILC
jgi:hypothetical protein